jgi:hypothetical protein
MILATVGLPLVGGSRHPHMYIMLYDIFGIGGL